MAKLIKILFGLILLIIISIVGVLSSVDLNQYKPEIISAVEEQTGRKLEIGGELKFAISLVPTVLVEDVKFSNAGWGSQPEMIKLDKFEIEVALLPLISGDIQVNKLILLAPDILLETNQKGIGNWVFAKQQKQEEQEQDSSSADIPSVVIKKVLIEDANLTYLDGVSGQKTAVVIEQISVQSDGAGSPLALALKLVYNELPINVEGQLGSLSQIAANEVIPVDIKAMLGEAELSVKGEVKQPTKAKGLALDIAFNVESLAQLSTLSGSELPDLGPIELATTIKDIKTGYAISALKLNAVGTDLTGDLTANLSTKVPSITATLSSELIDLTAFSNEEAESKEPEQQAEKSERIFSDEPLVLDGLKAINATVQLNAKQIKTSSLALADTQVSVKLNNGNLTIKPLSTLLAGGRLAGDVALNNTGQSADLKAKLTIADLQPNQFVDMSDKLTGAATDLDIDLAGKGASVRQLMAGLNGKFIVKVGEGKLTDSVLGTLGADALTNLVSMLNPLSESSDATLLKCSVVNFTIKDGIATTDQGIAVSTDQMNIIGSGTINLKDETLDIGIKPEAKEGLGINAGKLASLVKVGGTLANPTPTTDVGGALSTGASVGAAVATGGLSLLAEGLLDRATADADPCATALGQKPAKQAEAKSEAPKQESIQNKATDAVKDAAGGIGDTLKNLF